ncbi:hypothetical protein DXG01_012246 [Tephrocybe rancida]|nr:hypothetical protein DXG01_012246 [Tephrocybe rancida]
MAIATLPPSTRSLPVIVVSDEETLPQRHHGTSPLRARKGGNKGRESDVHDDSYSGAIISIGPHTELALDRFNLSAQEIPKMRILTQTERSSKWAERMREGEFSYSFEIASTMAEALHADISARSDRQTEVRCGVTKFVNPASDRAPPRRSKPPLPRIIH